MCPSTIIILDRFSHPAAETTKKYFSIIPSALRSAIPPSKRFSASPDRWDFNIFALARSDGQKLFSVFNPFYISLTCTLNMVDPVWRNWRKDFMAKWSEYPYRFCSRKWTLVRTVRPGFWRNWSFDVLSEWIYFIPFRYFVVQGSEWRY